MKKEFLDLTPKRYLCPYCGQWHSFDSHRELGYYDSDYQAHYPCSNAPFGYNEGDYSFYFYEDYLYYSTEAMCGMAYLEINGKIPISSIVESPDKPIVTFDVDFTSDNDVGSYECSDCNFKDQCNCVRLGDKGDHRHMTITLGFEFEQSEYDELTEDAQLERKERELQERENAVKSMEQSLQERENAVKSMEQSLQERERLLLEQQHLEESTLQSNNKEDTIMSEAKKTSIRTQLYEKSPKENLEIVKEWSEKYKPVLRWAIPMVAVYGAYRILNSDEFDLSVNNISATFEKQLGFKVEFLENKKALKELMTIGGLSATAYGAVKAVSGILGNKEEKDVSVEDVEAGMNQLESISKKFAWIQPKTEDMLPIAFSVILVYVTLHKPKFTGKVANKVRDLTEDFRFKLDTYVDLAKLFIQDKFNIDLSNEEEQKKLKICAFLVAVMGIFAFLYGRKVLAGKGEAAVADVFTEEEAPKPMEAFIEQAKAIIEKIAPTVYTTLITFLVSKKVLMLEEPLSIPDESGDSAVTDN